MKRRDFITASGIGLAAATIAAPAIAQSMPELKWRMTTSWPKTLDTLYGGAEQMCRAIAEAKKSERKSAILSASKRQSDGQTVCLRIGKRNDGVPHV